MKKTILLVVSLLAASSFIGCSSRSVMPDKDEIKVTREMPDKDDKCKEIGQIMGRSATVKATREDVLEDLKQTAANKGANYVVVKQYSAQGTTVTGIAYECP